MKSAGDNLVSDALLRINEKESMNKEVILLTKPRRTLRLKGTIAERPKKKEA